MSSAVQGGDYPHLQEWHGVLCQAVKEVFSLMVGAEVAVHSDLILDTQADVTAMVGLAGELCGLLTIRCSSKTAVAMASRMLDTEVAEASPHQADAIGEICNMIAGNFKAKIAGLEDKCLLSVPTVITGPSYEIHSLEMEFKIQIPFSLETQPFWVVLELKELPAS